jgi:hypothetical protein
MAKSHRAEVGGGAVVVGVAVIAAYSTGVIPPIKTDLGGGGADAGRAGGWVPAPPAELGVGGTYRNVKFGVSINPEAEVTVELGVGAGGVGATVKVIRFTGKDGTLVFFPDHEVKLGVECGRQTITWSGAEGFGREFGMKLGGMSGRVEFEATVGFPKPAQLPRTGTLAFDGNRPLLTGPLLPEAK